MRDLKVRPKRKGSKPANHQDGAIEPYKPKSPAVVAALVERARQGDKNCLPELRSVLWAEAQGRRVPYYLDHYGSPPEWVRRVLTADAAGENPVAREALKIKLLAVRRELEGPHPTPIEKLLAERAALCWLVVNLYELRATTDEPASSRQATDDRRLLDSAHRRFLSALRTLAQVRKLALPTLQVNIGTNQLNLTGRPRPAGTRKDARSKTSDSGIKI